MPFFVGGGANITSVSQLATGVVNSAAILNDSIVDADIKSNAAIAQSKLATLSITEALQTLADNITNDVSSSKHGYTPKAPNDVSKELSGTGAWTTKPLELLYVTQSNITSTSEVELFTYTVASGKLNVKDKLIVMFDGVNASDVGLLKIRVNDGTNTYTSSGFTSQSAGTPHDITEFWISQGFEATTTLSMIRLRRGNVQQTASEVSTMISNFMSAGFTVSCRGNINASGTLYYTAYIYKLSSV